MSVEVIASNEHSWKHSDSVGYNHYIWDYFIP